MPFHVQRDVGGGCRVVGQQTLAAMKTGNAAHRSIRPGTVVTTDRSGGHRRSHPGRRCIIYREFEFIPAAISARTWISDLSDPAGSAGGSGVLHARMGDDDYAAERAARAPGMCLPSTACRVPFGAGPTTTVTTCAFGRTRRGAARHGTPGPGPLAPRHHGHGRTHGASARCKPFRAATGRAPARSRHVRYDQHSPAGSSIARSSYGNHIVRRRAPNLGSLPAGPIPHAQKMKREEDLRAQHPPVTHSLPGLLAGVLP